MAIHKLNPLNLRALFHPDAAELLPLLELPAKFLAGLPEPISLRLKVAGAPAPICFKTSARSEIAPVLAPVITFDGAELAALVCGIEADRVWHPEFLGFCFEKWRQPSFELTQGVALAGANPDDAASFSLLRVLQRLEARVEQLELVVDQSMKAAAHERHAMHVAA
jgi:hypothetical protein